MLCRWDVLCLHKLGIGWWLQGAGDDDDEQEEKGLVSFGAMREASVAQYRSVGCRRSDTAEEPRQMRRNDATGFVVVSASSEALPTFQHVEGQGVRATRRQSPLDEPQRVVGTRAMHLWSLPARLFLVVCGRLLKCARGLSSLSAPKDSVLYLSHGLP